MNIETYSKLQYQENNLQIAIDFDGVIHRNSKNLSYDLKVINELILGNEHKKDID